MLYIKAPGRCIHHDSPAIAWGGLTRYLEVAGDQFAIRQIELFKNGNALRYDRSHWCDAFGQLVGLRFSRKAKWAVYFPRAEVIGGTGFEKAWEAAMPSPLWTDQVARSRVEEWGAVPSWLRRA